MSTEQDARTHRPNSINCVCGDCWREDVKQKAEQDASKTRELTALRERVATLEAERDELKKAAVKHQEMFWPPKNKEEEHLYEIRNGKVKEYVMAHVEALNSATAEARVRELEAALRHTLEGQHVVGSDGCADCREARALLSKESK